MKIQITRANAFEIDAHKRYLVIVSTPQDMTKQEVEDANEAIRAHFPNMSVVFLNPSNKFRVVEAPDESAA